MSELKERQLTKIIEEVFKNWDDIDKKYGKAEKQLKKMLRDYDMVLEYLDGVNPDWLPTPEHINELPEPIRKYIHDIETNCDPAHLVRENVLIKDTCKMLVLKLEEKKKKEESDEEI